MSDRAKDHLNDDERQQLVDDLREASAFLKAQGLGRLAKQVWNAANHVVETGKVQRPWAPTSGTMAD